MKKEIRVGLLFLILHGVIMAYHQSVAILPISTIFI
jgi:hypothetical protein